MGLVKKNRVLWSISEWLLFPSSCQEHKGIFLGYLLWEPSQVPGGNLTMFWGPLYDWITPEFFTFRVVRTEPSPICPLQFRFSYPGAGSGGGFCASLCSGELRLSVFACPSLHYWGQQFTLCPPLPYGSKNSCLLIFQSVQLFTCYQDGAVTSKLLTSRTGN